ncbi:alpha/beta fold hydrolase [Actinomycetospora termitidis]|uniref:Alpha/beta hydrolase n=1 Tax=Actinomycetospora termitidis TaxID=3053470 RepID=A0ABT7M804_9PSEU|nr:alpha/beta hydrolase [Actinomycetospora sp. Odt1-22]MDL5156787.1 alpha/beta hydrolase [Actinomycetospora sp. Odt1-22]
MTSTEQRVPAADGVRLHVAVDGPVDAPAVLLLHGFPQTHLMWRHVAADLARDHRVIAPDLRGYGASDKPADSGTTYAKRTMAADVVAVARHLGVERFALAGHDRGALVAIRAGLDHPDAISHLTILDVLPVPEMWDVLHGVDAAVAFHLYLMAQPPGLAGTMIAGAPDAFFGFFLDAWGGSFPDDVRAEYLRASREAVPSIVADYRASATVDLELDRASRAAGERLAMPVTVVQQNWGAALGFDAADLWKPWAADLTHRTLDAGHFMAETAPDEVSALIRRRAAPSRPTAR